MLKVPLYPNQSIYRFMVLWAWIQGWPWNDLEF